MLLPFLHIFLPFISCPIPAYHTKHKRHANADQVPNSACEELDLVQILNQGLCMETIIDPVTTSSTDRSSAKVDSE